ncbi:uncharacterized protein [Watersipora subatra]|uniref:uncharacterized protein n=1 Tax=Watersipora subatra TaxID=2589382 RepID=UPI00355C4886
MAHDSETGPWQEVLIDEVHKRRCLWDKNHPSSRSALTKSNQWKEVAEALTPEYGSWNEAKASEKWSSLRDGFVRQQRRLREGMDSGRTLWRWYNQMEWLAKGLDSTKVAVRHEDKSFEMSEDECDTLSQTSPSTHDDTKNAATPGAVSVVSEKTEPVVVNSINRRPNIWNHKRRRPIREVEIPAANIRESDPLYYDEAHLVGMSIAAKLRKMDKYQAALARRDIEIALFNAQYSQKPTTSTQPPKGDDDV